MNSLLEEELKELEEKNLYRRCKTLEKAGPVTAYLDGRELTLFCGNDYLGLSFHPRVIARVKAEAERVGAGSGAARLISGTTSLHSRLELELAKLKKKPRTLLFGSGYLANLGILSALAGKSDLILMDKLCHASIIDGVRLSGAEMRVYPHKNYERCEEILKQNINGLKTSAQRKTMLVTDAVFSMDGDLADLKALVRLKEKYQAMLVVDDAHGTGVLGLTGGGAAEDSGLEDKIDVIMGTLSKALGTIGGFAAASETLIEYLTNFSRPFIYSTSLPPVMCAAALESLAVLQDEKAIREKLWRNIQRMHQLLTQLNFDPGPITSPIFPIILGDEKAALEASEALFHKGILVPAIRPPTVPKGKSRLRLTVSTAHEEQHFEKLYESLRSLVNVKDK